MLLLMVNSTIQCTLFCDNSIFFKEIKSFDPFFVPALHQKLYCMKFYWKMRKRSHATIADLQRRDRKQAVSTWTTQWIIENNINPYLDSFCWRSQS